MENRTKVVVEVSSIVVALCAFFTAAFLGFSEFTDRRTAVLPALTAKVTIDTNPNPSKISLQLTNSGFGPARISFVDLTTKKEVKYSSIEVNGKKKIVSSTWKDEFEVLEAPLILPPNQSFTVSISFSGNGWSLDDYWTNFGYSTECHSIYREKCEIYGELPTEI